MKRTITNSDYFLQMLYYSIFILESHFLVDLHFIHFIIDAMKLWNWKDIFKFLKIRKKQSLLKSINSLKFLNKIINYSNKKNAFLHMPALFYNNECRLLYLEHEKRKKTACHQVIKVTWVLNMLKSIHFQIIS